MIKYFVYATLFTAVMLVLIPSVTHNEQEKLSVDVNKKFDCQIYSNHEIHEYKDCHFVNEKTIYWGDK